MSPRIAWLARAGIALLAAFSFASNGAAQEPAKVRIALPIIALSMAPIFYARDAGLFRRNGLEVELVAFRGGPPADAALLSGDVDFLAGGTYDFLKFADSGRVMHILTYLSALTIEFVASDRIIAARGITPTMSPKERLARLRDTDLGTVSLGGASESFARWLLKFGGVDPDRDVRKIQLGGMAQLVSAMQAGQIDGFVVSPPVGSVARRLGIGRTIVDFTEVPELEGYLFMGLEARTDYLAAQGPVAARLVQAIVAAQRDLSEHPNEAARVLKAGGFAQNEAEDIEQALVAMKDAFRPHRMTEADWQHTRRIIRDSVGDNALSATAVKAEVHWTNRFFDDAEKP